MLIKELKITNKNGDSIEFGRHFLLLEDIDFSNLSANVGFVETIHDGSNHQRSKLNNRPFDIKFYINKRGREKWWIEERRRELFKILNPRFNPMRLDFKTQADEEYYTTSNLMGTPGFPRGFENSNKAWEKSLAQFESNDPYIYKKEEKRVDAATWVGAFEFPFSFEDTFEVGYRQQSLIVNIFNEGHVETGFKAILKASSKVKNPYIETADGLQTFKLNGDMQAGDMIEISTVNRNKYAKLIRSGVESNIFNSIDITSKFIQLQPGDNMIKYGADEGIDYLDISYYLNERLVGV